MAVVIRLARFGTKHAPKYRITVADHRRYVTGKYLEILGVYIPTPQGKDKKVVMDLAKAQDWISKGAQPSDRVKHIMKLAQAETQAAK
jgi:small subunit ribosomal protein S16